MDLIAFLVLMLPSHRAHLLTRLSCSSLPRLCSYHFETVDDDANGQVGRSPRSIQGPVLPVKMQPPPPNGFCLSSNPVPLHPTFTPLCIDTASWSWVFLVPPPRHCTAVHSHRPVDSPRVCRFLFTTRHDPSREKSVESSTSRPLSVVWAPSFSATTPPVSCIPLHSIERTLPNSSSQQRDRTSQNVLCSVLQTPRVSTAICWAGGGRRSSIRLSQVECRAGRR